MPDNPKTLLEKLREAIAIPDADPERYYLSNMHILAEAQDMDAFPIFVKLLSDERPDWVRYALEAIGFHYRLDPQGEVVHKVRQLLLNHHDENVRTTATFVLASKSRWPDFALLHALEEDDSIFVRYSVLNALLDLARFPYRLREEHLARLEKGKVSPTVATLKEILVQNDKSELINDLEDCLRKE
jgi:hypothetical protein